MATLEALLERMARDIKTRGLSESSVRNYAHGVRRFSKFVEKDLEQVVIEDVQKFHLHLVDSQLSEQTVNLYMAGVRFLFLRTLERNWNPSNIPHMKVKRRLPIVLSPEKIADLLNAVNDLKYRAVLLTIYSAGLRVREATQLEACDILSDRMQIHVRKGKGGKERFTVLSEYCLQELRHYYRNYPQDKKQFLFPGQNPSTPINPSAVRKVLAIAKERVGIEANVRVHSMRHSFATHLLESGVDLRIIQLLLGHASISSTTLYTHLRDQRSLGVKSPLDAIAEKLSRP